MKLVTGAGEWIPLHWEPYSLKEGLGTKRSTVLQDQPAEPSERIMIALADIWWQERG